MKQDSQDKLATQSNNSITKQIQKKYLDMMYDFLEITKRRTGCLDARFDSTDLLKLFERHNQLKPQQFAEIMANGSFGQYGRTYKLTIQEISIWIKNYISDNGLNYDGSKKDLTELLKSR